MNYLIETEKLRKRYGEALRVKDVNLRVPEGSVYGFLGPNGAGKSTTLKMILGLTHPTSGIIRVFGKELNEKTRLGILRDAGSLIESPSYYGHLTGEENLKLVQTLRGVPEKSISEALSVVRLEDHKDKKVSQYSLGMKQRLGLAAALLAKPKLLILDEPTNGLDPYGIQEIRELICELPGKFGMTVVVSSHILSEIDQMATHVGIIADGALVYQDTMERLHEKSEHHLIIRTLDDNTARNILRCVGVSCELCDDGLVLPPYTDEKAAWSVEELVRGGAKVVRVEERRKNLEDIFLELTEGAAGL